MKYLKNEEAVFYISVAFQVATFALLVAAANAGFLSAPVAYSAPAIAPVAYSAPAVVKAAVPVATSYQNTYKVKIIAQISSKTSSSGSIHNYLFSSFVVQILLGISNKKCISKFQNSISFWHALSTVIASVGTEVAET